jgi:hypothetical protein
MREKEFQEELAELVDDKTPAKSKRTRKPRQKASEAAPAPVEVVKVNPGVWTKALEIANGDARRIEVLAHNKVMVS